MVVVSPHLQCIVIAVRFTVIVIQIAIMGSAAAVDYAMVVATIAQMEQRQTHVTLHTYGVFVCRAQGYWMYSTRKVHCIISFY